MRAHQRLSSLDADPEADLRQEREADYRAFSLGGSHYAIGYAMGRATPLREVERWRAAEADLAFARACAAVIAGYHPALLDEFAGFAAAQGRPWEDVAAHLSLNLPEGELSGCTTVAWRLPDEHVMVARNYDFLYTQRQRYLRRLAPDGSPASLGTQAGLIGSCYDGVNEHGLFVALHLVHAQIAPRVPPGVPYHLIPRIVLERCRTAREAAALILDMPHLFAFNYLLADASDILGVETYPGLARLREAEDGCLVVTNTFLHPDLAPLQGRRPVERHLARTRWAERHLREDAPGGAAAAWEWAMALLRDHSTPMCHHRPTQATLWALVADLTARRIAYCGGAPCRNPFVERRWPGTAPAGEAASPIICPSWECV
jgi:hypothetical protein